MTVPATSVSVPEPDRNPYTYSFLLKSKFARQNLISSLKIMPPHFAQLAVRDVYLSSLVKYTPPLIISWYASKFASIDFFFLLLFFFFLPLKFAFATGPSGRQVQIGEENEMREQEVS